MAHDLIAEDHVRVRGFATIAALHSVGGKGDPVRTVDQPKGGDNPVSLRSDSLLGLQLDYTLTDDVNATVQGLSRYHGSGDFSPEVMLAFLKYTPRHDLDIRLGRIGWDAYAFSETRFVGYSYPWIRPPVEVFGLLQLPFIEGADVTYRHPVGRGVLSATAFAGRGGSEKLYFTDDTSARIERGRAGGGHLDYRTQDWFMRLGYTRLHMDPDYHYSNPNKFSLQELRTLLQQGVDFSDLYGISDIEFVSLALDWTPARWQINAMVNRTSLAGKGGHIDSGLVSAGYRIERFMPYVVVSYTDANPEQDLSGNNFWQRTIGVGTRFDVATNAALKLQVDHVTVDGAAPFWRGRGDDYSRQERVMLGLGLDIVF
ncbi:hypothetical protein [Larsenimonas suaedae]|uniref:Porin n=1 Tax=Larsenimonas suaedae TaxID=1851019 RepID=A0ABU1GSN0_9GAMM|nr:hypothetical protein [Larsenimonas suaedae]MCM2972617.1 hypothetical protein [Larsenimonas suaedae]MDR5894587.1 hypothetical protein [Larsenimonas suaedae]